MKLYQKEMDGKMIVRRLKDIVVIKDGMQTFNPSEEMALADGWVEYVPSVQEYTEEELLERAKEEKIRELYEYDESEEVNNCIISYQGMDMDYWADKHERDALKSALQDCISLGRSTYRLDLRNKGISMSIPCEKLLYMMAVLEVYAVDCFNRTTDHEFAIKSLSTTEEVYAYRFRRNGYPEMPRFSIDQTLTE